ncbi:MAG: hypothetical protein ACOYXM_07545 [Actinomycetota bacterium]
MDISTSLVASFVVLVLLLLQPGLLVLRNSMRARQLPALPAPVSRTVAR